MAQNINLLYLIAIFIACYSNHSFAQRTLEGLVVNQEGTPVGEVHIIVETIKSHEIIAFGFSNESGLYEIDISSQEDSLSLTVSHISYNTKHVIVDTKKHYQIELTNRDQSLPEIIVRTEPVVRRGDTLVFDVQSYSRDIDVSLEDVLRRIPGVSVEDNGKISYRGLGISKFFIEGLDLLEGKYKIATRNLDMNAVLDIEIIEHHQHKKALEGLVRPEEAAINLKLKSKVALTGSGKVGTGLDPLLHILHADAFGFGKDYQFSLLAGSNNFGISQKNNYENLYQEAPKFTMQLTSVNQLLHPLQLKREEYIDNNEHIGGLSLLKKLSSSSQLKWHLKYSDDILSTSGNEVLSFSSGMDDFRQLLTYQNSNNDAHLNNSFIYELNTNSLFLRANTDLSFDCNETIGDHLFNANSSPEYLKSTSISASSNIETTIRGSNKALTIFTDLSYRKNSDSLTVNSTSLFIPDPIRIINSNLLQTATIKDFRAHSFTSFLNKFNQISSNTSVGVNYTSVKLISELSDTNIDNQSTMTPVLFQNDNSLTEWAPYLNQAFKIDDKNSTWQLSIPLSWYHYSFNNSLDESNKRESGIFYDLFLEHNKLLTKGYGLHISYKYSHNFDDYRKPLYDNYILRSNRNLSKSSVNINRYRKHELTMTIDRNDYMHNLYYRVIGTVSSAKYDLINDENFIEFGTSSDLIDEDNNRKRASMDMLISGQLLNIIDVKANIDLSFNKMAIISNGVRNNVNFSTSLSKMEFSYLFGRSIVSFKPSWFHQSNDLLQDAADYVSLRFVYFIKNRNIGSLEFNFDKYLIKTKNSEQWNSLLGIEYKREFTKQKIDFSLTLSNLTNASQFVSYEQNSYFSRLAELNLRPFQVKSSIRKRF